MRWLTWAEHTRVSEWILGSTSIWAYPTVLTLHTVGLAMLVGGYITARAGGSGAEGSGGLTGLDGLLDSLTPTGGEADRI